MSNLDLIQKAKDAGVPVTVILQAQQDTAQRMKALDMRCQQAITQTRVRNETIKSRTDR